MERFGSDLGGASLHSMLGNITKTPDVISGQHNIWPAVVYEYHWRTTVGSTEKHPDPDSTEIIKSGIFFNFGILPRTHARC